MEGDTQVVVHWDIENLSVPRGSSTIQTCYRIRQAIKNALPGHCIQDLFVYADVAKMAPQQRQDLRMAGSDVIDTSTVQGKRGQVDLAIMARALKSKEGVIICSGDSDFAYTMAHIRHSGRLTGVLYNVDNMGSVSTALLEVAEHAIGVSLTGVNYEDALAVLDLEPSSEPPTVLEAAFLEAMRRAPALADGWAQGPAVGVLFRTLAPSADKGSFKRTKAALVAQGRLTTHATADSMRLAPVDGA